MAKKKKGGLILNLKKSANKAAKNKKKKSGVVISEKSAQKKQAAQKANKSLKKAFNYTEGTGKVEKGKSTSEAIEIGKKKSALGTKVEKKTGTVEVQKYSHPRTREKVEYEYTPMTMQEYTTMATGTQQGRLKETLNTNKDLKKKVTDLNVKDYAEGAFGMGMLDQMTQGLSVSEDPTYEYSESQKKIMDNAKQSGKYNVGRVVGAVAEFGLGGTGTIGSSIAKTGGKAVLKEAAEQGGKKLAKQTAKNIAKETGGDTVASLGLNTLDAVKFSYEDGKLNKEKFVKELALNVGGDIVIGGVVSGLVHGLSARQVSNFNRINKILQKGGKVSDAEMKFYNKHVKELGDKVEAKVKQEDEQVTPQTAVDDNYTVNKSGFADVSNNYKEMSPKVLDDSYKTSSIKSTNVADSHKTVFAEYSTSTNPKLVKYVKDVLAKKQTTKTATLGTVNAKNAKTIEEITGIDTTDFEHIIGKNDIEHINRRHGKSGRHDTTMADVNDIGRLEYVVDNADAIYRTLDEKGNLRFSDGYIDQYGEKVPLITFEKQVDGHVYVVEAVIDAKYGKMRVVTTYMNKVGGIKKESPRTVSASDSSPHSTSETESGSLSTSTIAENSTNVKSAEWETTAKNAAEDPGKQFDTADEVFPTWEEISRKAYEVAEDEEKLVTLRKEYDTLKYKAQNTKNPEHYSEYIRRRWEIADILDEIAEKKKVKNVATPTRSTVEKADDLVNAANGTYKEDIKTLTKVNSRGLDNLYRIFVDTFHGFEQFARQLPKESRDIFRTQINAVRNSKNKAGGWLSEARVNAEGKRIGNSFNDIMGDLLQPKNAKKYEDFQYYCANKHNIDRYGQGKGVFGDKINAEESRKICEQLDKDYPDFAKKQEAVVEYFKDLQQARVDFGLISKETAEYLDALYSNYVPTYRVVEGKRVGISDSPKNTLEIGNVIKTATGGDSELLPLHEQVANLTEYTFKLGEQNRLMNLLATTQGVNVKSLDPSIRLEDAIDACTFTSKETDGATNKFYVAFFDGGAPRKVEVSEQMWLGIKEWRNDPDSLAAMFNWKAKHIRGANALFKNLITGWNPIFGVKNIVKDTGEALIYTKNVRGFIKAYPKAIAAVTKHGKYSKYFDIYQASGGKYAHIREDITTFNTDSTFKKVLKSPVELCQRFNDCLEAIPRMAEFISTIDSSLDAKKILKGGGSIDDVLSKINNKTINRALYNANEVTLNFGRSGVASKALNSTVIPYLNPAIQGLDKLVRVFRDAGADGARGMLGLFGKIGAAAIVPAMFNEVMMTLYGGEDYQILNTRDKNNNYFIPMGDGKFIKIPKARVSAALASPFEHIYRHVMYGDSMEWKQMFSTAWTNVGVMNPLESSLFSPIMLALSNKTWYGGNIENASDLDLRAVGEKSEIYDATTSAIAIWIGDKVNMSPKKIDYIIDSYTGVIGDFLLPMTAEASNGNPLFKNFILDSVFSNKLATTFWEKNTTLEAYSEARGGEHSTKHEDWKAEYMYDALTINRAINDIDADKSLTKKEKAELKRELRKGLNKYYAAGTNGTSIDLEPVSFIAKHIGADKALTNYLPDSDNEKYSFKEHYKVFKELEGYSDKNNKGKNAIANEFLKTYKLAVETQKQIDVAYHNSPNWTTIAIANVIKGTSDNISLACGVYEDSLEDAKTYIEYGGDDKKYIATQKRINKIIDKLEKSGVDTSDNIYKKYLKSGVTALSLASGTTKFKDRAYFISYSDGKMNASRGLMSQYDWSISEVVKLGFSADADGNTYLKKQEVVDVIESSKASTREEKAMLFNIIYGDSGNNPYGSIGDYSLDGDTGITRDKETSSTGSSASKKSNTLPSWEDYIKDFISSSEATSGVKFTDWDSPLDKTYQNKIKAILKKMEV